MKELPSALADTLDEPFWRHAEQGKLAIQRCLDCGTWRWTPEWICYSCRSWSFDFQIVEPHGVIAAWERIWHPVHPALAQDCPYLVVLVELPQAGRVRLIGRLLGEPLQDPMLGSAVQPVFRRTRAEPPAVPVMIEWRRFTNESA